MLNDMLMSFTEGLGFGIGFGGTLAIALVVLGWKASKKEKSNG